MFSRKAPSCVSEERRAAAAQAQHSPQHWDPHKAVEQPGKEAELLLLNILDSAELGLSQTTARNFWSSISFSWGELELVPRETLPGLPSAMPWGSHKEMGH